jgi:hypothetical protein
MANLIIITSSFRRRTQLSLPFGALNYFANSTRQLQRMYEDITPLREEKKCLHHVTGCSEQFNHVIGRSEQFLIDTIFCLSSSHEQDPEAEGDSNANKQFFFM